MSQKATESENLLSDKRKLNSHKCTYCQISKYISIGYATYITYWQRNFTEAMIIFVIKYLNPK